MRRSMAMPIGGGGNGPISRMPSGRVPLPPHIAGFRGPPGVVAAGPGPGPPGGFPGAVAGRRPSSLPQGPGPPGGGGGVVAIGRRSSLPNSLSSPIRPTTASSSDSDGRTLSQPWERSPGGGGGRRASHVLSPSKAASAAKSRHTIGPVSPNAPLPLPPSATGAGDENDGNNDLGPPPSYVDSHAPPIKAAERKPFGTLAVKVVKCGSLRAGKGAFGKADPYVKIKVGEREVRTAPVPQGGKEPVFNKDFSFDIVTEQELDVEVFDKEVVGEDKLMGKAKVSILDWIAQGKYSGKIDLIDDSKRLAGHIELQASFSSPSSSSSSSSSSSPGGERDHGDIPSSPLSLSPMPPSSSPEPSAPPITSVNASIGGDVSPVASSPQHQQQHMHSKGGRIGGTSSSGTASSGISSTSGRNMQDGNFSDDEILGAFRAFDLDKNNYVGAAEIRHVLINIGERVTDEEIDEMIRMVDRDGDGQVSFGEFYKMVTGGKIAPPGLGRRQTSSNSIVVGGGPGGSSSSSLSTIGGFGDGGGGGGGGGGSIISRQSSFSLAPSPPTGPAVVQARNRKRKALDEFSRDNNLRPESIKRGYR